MRIIGITAANNNPYRNLPAISFVFTILQFQIMISHLIRKQNFWKGLFLPFALFLLLTGVCC
jgi:high-affinity Fe2+/Pb2+ permease